MLSKAQAKYIRQSARKTRLVIEVVKGKSVSEANFMLDNMNKGASRAVKNVVNSAFANANHNRQEEISASDMVISHIRADEGPTLKRWRAATMGRATPIRHRTAHIYVELSRAEKKDSVSKKNM